MAMQSFQRLPAPILGILVLLLLVLNSYAWSIPDKLRLNSNGQPRLCSAVGVGLNIMTRAALCFPSSSEEFAIKVSSKSNRAVLRGDIQQISIHVKQSKSPLLQLNQFDLQGSNLKFGWIPLVLTVAPLAMPFLVSAIRRYLLLMITYYCLWKMRKQRLATDSSNRIINRSADNTESEVSLGARLKGALGGAPCNLNYSMVLTNDNIENSTILRRAANLILESLMTNSVLKTAAIAGDTAQMLQDVETDESGKLVLKESSFQLTKLLSATSFELLQAPTFANDGHLVLTSQAVLPSQSSLDFILRTKIQGNEMAREGKIFSEKQYGLEFAYPECRFETAAAPLPGLIKNNILPPILWLPVGPGVAVPLGKQHQIKGVYISEGKCRLNGRISFFEKEQRRGLLRRKFENFFSNRKRLLLPPKDKKP